jgi:hypothetical protein
MPREGNDTEDRGSLLEVRTTCEVGLCPLDRVLAMIKSVDRKWHQEDEQERECALDADPLDTWDSHDAGTPAQHL